MPIPFTCDSCGRSLNVRDELAGQQIYCPDCKTILTVPLEAPPEPAPEYEVPMAEVAPPAEHDALSARAEEPAPPPKPPVPQLEDWDEEDVEPTPRQAAPTPAAPTGPNIGAVLGGIGLMGGAVVLVLIGIVTGFWIIKLIVILFIAGIVTFLKGLFGKTD
jgi:hypothetical protein